MATTLKLQPTFEMSHDGKTRARSPRQQLALLHLACHKVPTLFAYCSANTRSNSFFLTFEPYLFSSLLMSHIYKEFVLPITHQFSFAWDMSTAVNALDALKPVMRTWIHQPHDYYEDDIDAALAHLKKQPQYSHASRLGFVITDCIFIRVDLVARRHNTLVPVIVVSDKFKRKSHPALDDQMRAKASATNNWIARLDESNTMVYNRRHPSYVSITLAMYALNATTGIVIHYEPSTKSCTEFTVVYDFDHRRIIMQRALFYFGVFCDIIQAEVKQPIPFLNVSSDAFDLTLSDDDDNTIVLHEKKDCSTFPWHRPPYTAIRYELHQEPPVQPQILAPDNDELPDIVFDEIDG